MAKVYLGLGSNMGDKEGYIKKAIKLLNDNDFIQVTIISSYYETEPVGYTEQDLFLNIVAEINTTLNPYDLLDYCNSIENKLNRKRIIRWGPRTIDIDILLYENYTSFDEKLTIPHPRMCERSFVIIPLYEIAKDIRINNISIEDVLHNLNKKGIMKKS